jgi:hypothetical protein
MSLGYDIFRQLGDGSPLWIAHVKTIGEAKVKLSTLQQSNPGEYFLRNAGSGELMFDAMTRPPGIPKPSETA